MGEKMKIYAMKLKKYIKNNWWQPGDKWSILAVAIVASLLFLLMRVEDRTYEKERLEMAEIIEKILIEKNLCKSKIDCQKKDYFYVSPFKSGISIGTYAVLSDEALMRITEASSSMFHSHKNMNIVMSGYEITQEEEMKYLFRGPDPFYRIEFWRSDK